MFDMAEDFDDPTVRWAVGTCPNPDCDEEPNLL